jgi:carboxypeptidase Taq
VSEKLKALQEIDREHRLLSRAAEVLQWDQETYMPAAAVQERAEQLALLHGLMHDRLTDPRVGELLEALGVGYGRPGEVSVPEGCSETERAFLRELARAYGRSTRIPRRVVTEMARQTAIAHRIWVHAREASDFSLFSGQLEVIVGLVREISECLGYEEHPYDPLLDEYEPWMKTAEVEEVFAGLGSGLSGLLWRIRDSEQAIATEFLSREYPLEKQRRFSLEVLRELGYDFQRGRLDESAHPFTTSLGSSDVRITTRYKAEFFPAGIFGTIHECGHALYELGFADELAGSLLADGASNGVHESQSRLWENLIGHSLPFWSRFFPRLKELFPGSLQDVDLKHFYRAVNCVAPSHIRVEADEVTYNLHIVLRFELEKLLVAGDLQVDDLPAAWNERFEELLGITVPDDARGVLQDIHWSGGMIGYFPTYALGNLYAAQFFAALQRDLPDWDRRVEQGRFDDILGWLRENIHRHGRVYPARELCSRATGETLSSRYLLDHLERKYGEIYGL